MALLNSIKASLKKDFTIPPTRVLDMIAILKNLSDTSCQEVDLITALSGGTNSIVLQYRLEILLNMDGVQDLFGPRQIALFDAIDELSSNVASDIEIPQLIVVGDQKVGRVLS